MSTGASGIYAPIAWDAESSSPSKVGLTHSTSVDPHLIACSRSGLYLFTANAKISDGVWTEFDARLEFDMGSGFEARPVVACPGGAVGVLDAATGPGTCAISCTCDMAAGDVVRLSCASIGQGSVALVTGEAFTWLEIRQLR